MTSTTLKDTKMQVTAEQLKSALKSAQSLVGLRIKFVKTDFEEQKSRSLWSQLPGKSALLAKLEELEHTLGAMQQHPIVPPHQVLPTLIGVLEDQLRVSDANREEAIKAEDWTEVVRHDGQGTAFVLVSKILQDELRLLPSRKTEG